MPNKKYNHYIPRFYLTNFSGNKNFIDKCILSSGKIIRCAPMSSTGGKITRDLKSKADFFR